MLKNYVYTKDKQNIRFTNYSTNIFNIKPTQPIILPPTCINKIYLNKLIRVNNSYA